MSRDKIEKWDEVNGITAPERNLEAFLESSTDTYAILQLRDSEDTRYERFASYSALQRQGKEPEIDHYDVVYLAPLPPFQDRGRMLEQMFVRFNFNHPADFRGHSLSVSDIVALNTGGEYPVIMWIRSGLWSCRVSFPGKIICGLPRTVWSRMTTVWTE